MSALIGALTAGPLAVGWPVHAWRLRRRIEAARRDPLTGLWTREPFEARARRLLLAGPRAVLLVDLNGFKAVNDTHGHAAGDALIAATGRRLAAWAGMHTGVAGRLGGDEFAAVIPCYGHDELDWDMADLLIDLTNVVVHDGVPLVPSAAIGVALCDPRTGPVDLPRVLRLSDEAMYRAKDDESPESAWQLANPASRMATVNGRRAGRLGMAKGGRS